MERNVKNIGDDYAAHQIRKKQRQQGYLHRDEPVSSVDLAAVVLVLAALVAVLWVA